MRKLADIKLMKEDPAGVEKMGEEIKTRYAADFQGVMPLTRSARHAPRRRGAPSPEAGGAFISQMHGRAAAMTIALPALSARTARIDLSWPILMLFAALLCVLIVLPMSWLVYYSLVDRSRRLHARQFPPLFTDPAFVDPLITTLILATSSSVDLLRWSRRRWAGWWRAPTCRCAAPCARWSRPRS